MEFRFNLICSKCGERLDVIGREIDKYCDELTVMVKPCRNGCDTEILTQPYAKVSAVNVESALG